MFVGQLAVLAFSTTDTVLIARYSALDLAAIAVGGATYITIFIGCMGVVLAVGPIAGQLFGARSFARQWPAAAPGDVAGAAALGHRLQGADLSRALHAHLARGARGRGEGACVPQRIGVRAARGPGVHGVPWLQHRGVAAEDRDGAAARQALVLKVPLTALLVYGLVWPTPFGTLAVPSLGAPGCGIATAIVMNLQLLVAWQVLRRDPFYSRFELGVAFPRRTARAWRPCSGWACRWAPRS